MFDQRHTGPRLVLLTAAVAILFLATCPPMIRAQSGGPYDLSWNSVDAGGATFSTGGAYVLGGTIGQHDPGLLTGGEYALGGGFWGGGALVVRYGLYLPLVVRNGP
jgi:hypothetical protein